MADKPVSENPTVGLFVTCLVDLFRPSIGFAAVKLLEDSGCIVEVPELQTCCGQPAYNSGDKKDAANIARKVINTFEQFDYVVAPSGSCAGMLKKHIPLLLESDPKWAQRAKEFGSRVHELITFLVDVRSIKSVNAKCNSRIAYHDSCSGLRELGIKDQPRQLLATVEGLELVEMKDSEICCGFGGTFAVKYADISNAMVDKKIDNISATKADVVLAGDLGCLMNMAGKAKREGINIEVRHVAEVLADMTDNPAICVSKNTKEK